MWKPTLRFLVEYHTMMQVPMAFHGEDMTLTATLPHSFPATTSQEVDLYPVSSELTVAEAAILLGMSEDCVDCLLDIDVLKYRQEGRQRLIDRENLFEYNEERERGGVILAEMCRMNQEMGLYDE